MEMGWTVYLQSHDSTEAIPLATFKRPVDRAAAADFGLSTAEGRELLVALQNAVAQRQIHAYDVSRRRCRHCGAYRQIKDWRPRVFATALGEVRLRVPRVVSCLCTPEPLDDNDDPVNLRFSECPIENLLPKRLSWPTSARSTVL